MKTEAELALLADKLRNRLKELSELSELTADDRKPVELDQTSVGRLSRMDSLQVQAMAAETQRRRALEKKRIHATLQRIEDGEYGYCAKCGEEIAEERLGVDPTVAMCIGCAG